VPQRWEPPPSRRPSDSRSRSFCITRRSSLDQAYDQAVWAPQLKELQAYDSTSSAAVRKVLPPRTERYGKSDIELIDIFTPANASGVAPTVVGRGAAYLTPDSNNVKQVRLPDMIEQCRSAVEWAVRNAASFGGDPNRVYTSGHSSGSHLASCVLTTDWTKRGCRLTRSRAPC
jgi:arylformamidase